MHTCTLAIRFAKTFTALGIEDPLVNPPQYLWHEIAQEHISGTHFCTIPAQGSAYITDYDLHAGESLQAFEHFVFESSQGDVVLRNFQGKFSN